jgi:molybdopterin synthase catalytic subunit
MITVQVRFFAAAADAAGAREAEFQLHGQPTLQNLVGLIEAKHERLQGYCGRLAYAVNQEYANNDIILQDGDEVAVIPPVSGGAENDRIELTADPIDPAEVTQWVCGDPANGGIDLFLGVTRSEEHPENGDLERLDYYAYEEMALKELHRLAVEARGRWPVGRLAIIHRTGQVGLGEPSVAVVVACPHRAESFEACRFLIDELKKTAPIWKQEVWRSKETSWAQGHSPESGDKAE